MNSIIDQQQDDKDFDITPNVTRVPDLYANCPGMKDFLNTPFPDNIPFRDSRIHKFALQWTK